MITRMHKPRTGRPPSRPGNTAPRAAATRRVPGQNPGYGKSATPAVNGPTQVRKEGRTMVVLRREIGDVLRDVRQRQGRTLREVSSAAQVSLGYLSEVERGQKEASSELLSSIAVALNVPLSMVLREVSDRIALVEGIAEIGRAWCKERRGEGV